ncbi:MAG: oxidoreductase [Candidatus Thorarchaeota archaeon]|nr:MAG: oxidoreductase [Candidatus Thorarchaeota archaeon]
MKLKGKVAIVTGSGAGIGEATAKLLAREGAKVACNDILEAASRVPKEIKQGGGEAMFIQGDVAVADDAKRIVGKTIDAYGRLDILCNIAGIVVPGRVDNANDSDWDKTMAVNVRGTYLLSKFAIPHLKKTQGTIVNTGSSVAIKGVKDRAAYSASKGAVVSLTRAMAADYVEDRIRVNCICPGTTDTPSLSQRIAQLPDPEAARKQFISRQPLGRFGKPEEIAEGILFLILNDFCTGTTLSVDGGMTV